MFQWSFMNFKNIFLDHIYYVDFVSVFNLISLFLVASPWVDNSRTPNKIDLYDVRRRPW